MQIMKKVLTIAALLALMAGSAYAQNDDAFEAFKQQRESQEEAFKEQRAREYEEFKTRYYEAFEEFVRLYRNYLEEDSRILDLMTSDDGIRIHPVDMAPAPRCVTTASEQRTILRRSIDSISGMKPEDVLPLLSDNSDTVDRMKEAATVMEEIVTAMDNGLQKEDNGQLETIGTEVVLEPYDPEYFSSLPGVEDQVQESPVEIPVEAPVETPSPAQTPAQADSAIPSGKPTDYVRISSPFGTRVHPITHKRHTHKGIDLAAPRNTPIYATADGVVTFSGRNGGYGNFVKINHRNGYKTAYAHMNKISVRKGAEVKKGDLIGYVGSTGASTGNHLHYEIYYQDALMDPATTL